MILLIDTENDEFSRSDRRNTNLDDQTSVQDVNFGHRLAASGHRVRLSFLGAEQCAFTPLCAKEQLYGLLDPRPKPLIIWLEYDSLRAPIDGHLEKDKQPPNADVVP